MGYFTGNGKDALALKDPYFNQVELLLKTKGSNGTDNGTFKDTSPTGHTITKSGSPIQGTFSPFSSNGWSGYFDGTGDTIQITNSADFDFGTGDFTMECWFNVSSWGSVANLCLWDNYNGSQGPRFNWVVGANGMGVDTTNGMNKGTATTHGTFNVGINEWHHAACVRDSTGIKNYLDGELKTSYATSSTEAYTPTNNNPRIGDYSDDYVTGAGYISNFRVVKGTALYTSTFTPPTEPLTAVTNTKLLTLQDNRPIDNSSSNHTITSTGDVAIKSKSPFRPSVTRNNTSALNRDGSAYFDGTDDYLIVSDNNDFDIESSDFTIELWYYRGDTNRHSLVNKRPSSGNSGYELRVDSSTNYPVFYFTAGSGFPTINYSIPSNQWSHIAVVRSGSNAYLFVDGDLKGSSTSWSNGVSNTQDLWIGHSAHNTGDYLNGYVSNLRVLKGTALYTSNFTPPTGPLRNVPDAKLLLNSINAPIYDATGKNNLLTLDTTQINTTIRKFSRPSVKFDGSSDGITIPSDKRFDLGQLWTVDGWFYVNAGTSYDCFFALQSTGGTSSPWYFVFGTDNTDDYATIRFRHAGGSGIVSLSNKITTNVWQHFACSYDGSNVRSYIDGNVWRTTSISISNWQGSTSSSLSIGYDPTGSNGGDLGPFNGYLSDFRFTAGVARYTGNSFSLPTEEYVSS